MSANEDPVVVEKTRDKWRFRCPNGHTNWETTNSHFWCHGCAAMHADVDATHRTLFDQKTGEDVSREELVIDVR